MPSEPVGGAPDPPRIWHTGALWGLLAFFLVVGTVALAFVVFALTVWVASGAYVLGIAVALAAGFVGVLAFLFMAGILYRVDRYRGANGRVVKFFE